jgi:uncharacterized protein (DUF2147 family)
MAQEIDRKIMPDWMQTTFAISLGAAFKSFEMMMSPMESANTMFSEMKALFTLPSDAGDGLQKKAEALAGVWMDKGMTLVERCKTAGEKFTEGK